MMDNFVATFYSPLPCSIKLLIQSNKRISIITSFKAVLNRFRIGFRDLDLLLLRAILKVSEQ